MVNYSLATRESQFARVQTPKVYAQVQTDQNISLAQFSKHISEHGAVYSRADVQAILLLAVDCLKEMLLDGKKVQLGELGSFYNSVKSVGADSASNFTANNITVLRANWDRGPAFRNYRDEATFNYVPNRKNQALLKSAEKGGAEVMNLYQTEGGNGGSGNGGGNNGGDDDPEDITEE